MDENKVYFDYTGQEAVPENTAAAGPQKGEKGSGKGLLLVGLIAGIGLTLLVVAIAYLGFGLQAVMERQDQPVLAEDSDACRHH